MNYAQLLIPDFLLILCGYLICRFTALNRTVWEQVESLGYYFLFPVLLFHSIVKSPMRWQSASHLISCGWLLGLTCITLAYSLPHWPILGRYIDRRAHAASAQVAFRFNSFIALALADRLAGPPGVLLIAVLIGCCVPVFNIAAVWPMARHSQHSLLPSLVRNPLIVATVSGLLLNVLGFSIPQWLEPSVARIGSASLALGLMAAGAGMQFAALTRGMVLGVSLLAIRHFMAPLVALVLARWLHLDHTQTIVLLTFSALPTA